MNKKALLRSAIILVGVLLVSGVSLVLFVKAKGNSSLDKARAAYIADGGSFDPQFRLAKPVPDDQNFGATPALNGITTDTPDGLALRNNLEQLGFKHPTVQWPTNNNYYRKQGHEPRQRRDLSQLHEYFLKTSLLPVNASASDPEHEQDIFHSFNSSYGPLIDELNQASLQPHSFFLPLEVDHPPSKVPEWMRSTADLTSFQAVAKGLGLHALLAIRTGHPAAAIADIRTLQKFAIAVQADRTSIISHLIGTAINSIAIDLIWEGLNDQVWSDAQLAELQSLLSARNISTDFTDAIRMELISNDQILLELKNNPSLAAGSGSPYSKSGKLLSPWINQSRATMIQLYHQDILVPMKSMDGYIQSYKKTEDRIDEIINSHALDPSSFYLKLIVPAATTLIEKSARSDAETSQAATACAIERYFLANKKYPDKLADLVPHLMNTVPIDPLNGKPMEYKKTPDGRYQLHSVGIDGLDHLGGAGDITWDYSTSPTPPPSAKKKRKK